MSANGLQVGGRYLTLTGLPVQVAALGSGCMLLRSLASGNEFEAPSSYELRPMGSGRSPLALKHSAAGVASVPSSGTLRPSAAERPLAPIIDALLMNGGMSMRGIVRDVNRKASAACRGKDVAANVRARLHWFRRRGYQIVRNPQGCLSAVRETA